jgi:hypothetical protein
MLSWSSTVATSKETAQTKSYVSPVPLNLTSVGLRALLLGIKKKES